MRATDRRCFVVLILGAVVVGSPILVEILFAPPLWVHLVLWTPVILGGAILMLRPLKAGLIALQYRHRGLAATPPHDGSRTCSGRKPSPMTRAARCHKPD